MSEFHNTVAAGLIEALDFIGETVVIGGKNVVGIVNAIKFEESFNSLGGMNDERGLTVVVAVMLIPPVIGDTLIYKGKSYRILELLEDETALELTCATDSK